MVRLAIGVVLAGFLCAAGHADELVSFRVEGNAIAAPLTGKPGDAARGRAIVTNRTIGLCLLCHSGPFPEERFQGNLAPDMRGAGTRWSTGELRLRMVDSHRLNPDTIMPAYYKIDGLNRVAPAFRGKPLLTAEQIEDVVAFLATLRD
jgi:sulfur-oxidizing protein SoxX